MVGGGGGGGVGEPVPGSAGPLPNHYRPRMDLFFFFSQQDETLATSPPPPPERHRYAVTNCPDVATRLQNHRCRFSLRPKSVHGTHEKERKKETT